MRVIVQRVSKASVNCSSGHSERIQQGMLIFLGVEENDNASDINWLTSKLSTLRIFSDENGKMNKSIIDINGDFMVISQFTLHASTKKGNRPSYMKAAKPEIAEPLYRSFMESLSEISGKRIAGGVFGDMMDVELINDGPVTIMMDSKNKE